MPCVHMTELIRLCEQSDLRLSSSDLIQIVCKQCQKQDVCPSALLEQVDESTSDGADDAAGLTTESKSP